MIVRSSALGDIPATPGASPSTLFDDSVGPYNVTFSYPWSYEAVVKGSSALPSSALWVQANQSWDGSPTTLLQRLMAAAAAKADQSGPLATAANQVAETLQNDVMNMETASNFMHYVSPMWPFDATAAQASGAVLALISDLALAETTLMQAAVQDTGGSAPGTPSGAVTATVPTRQVIAGVKGTVYATGPSMPSHIMLQLAPAQVRASLPGPAVKYDAAGVVAAGSPTDYTPYYAAGGAAVLILAMYLVSKR